MKLWQRSTTQLDERIEHFTIGRDRELDLQLARYDVIASIAHAQMLGETGIISPDEAALLIAELGAIAQRIEKGTFRIEEGVEDVHSQLELELTRALGTVGEKIHTARSRNDQVLTALVLYSRDRLAASARSVIALITTMLHWAERYKHVFMPGMTHLQVAMPSSFGLWMSGFAEALADDLEFFVAAMMLATKNPLGTAAGYGTSFPIDRQRTMELLGLRTLVVSSTAAQLLRGKLERTIATALGAVAATLARWASDVVFFASQALGFLRLPAAFSTGSSIMPHKQNPDVIELLRAHCNRLVMLQSEITAVTINLPSGYHRDYQVLKELLLPAWDLFDQCIEISTLVLPQLEPASDSLLDSQQYRALWSVEAIAQRMQSYGESFRSAYRAIAETLAHGTLPEKPQHYTTTHIGSVGNLSLERIAAQAHATMDRIDALRTPCNTGTFVRQ